MTDNYQVNDINGLLEQISNLKQINQNIYYVCDDLKTYVNQIRDAWQSDTTDRESYLGSLQRDLQNISILVTAIVKLNSNLETFATSAQDISKTV